MSNTFTNVAGFQVTNNVVNASNLVDFIIDFEGGEIGDDEVIALFQYLVDTGQAWTLQGLYGRAARNLIEGGHIYAADNLNRPDVIDGNVVEVRALPSGE